MDSIGRDFIKVIRGRIQGGLDIQDSPAPPLSDRRRGFRYSIKQGKQVTYNSRGYATAKRTMRRKMGASFPFDPLAPKAHGQIRDWTLTGHTLSNLVVLKASTNRCTIGFTSAARPGGRGITAAGVAAINNRRHRQFGVSPNDKRELAKLFHSYRPSSPAYSQPLRRAA